MKKLMNIWHNETRIWIKGLMIVFFIPVALWAAVKVLGAKICHFLSDMFYDLGSWLEN